MDETGDATATAVAPIAGPEVRPAPTPVPATTPVPAPAPTPAPFRLGHRPQLDGLRGIAVLIVVTHHVAKLLWPDASGWLAPGGHVGLDLFFALSGFLITVLLLGESQRRGRVALGAFARRRTLRLVPALVALMAGTVAVALTGERYSPGILLSSAGWVLTFSTNLAVERPIDELIHTWSLSVEMHFYLLWSVTTALVVRRARRPCPVLAGIAGAGIAVVAVARALAFHDGADVVTLYVSTLYRLDGPLVGALAGVAVVAGWADRIPRRWVAPAGVAALAGLLAVTFRTTPVSPVLFQGVFTVTAACGAVLLVTVLLAGTTRLGRAVSSRPLTALGLVSYSVYLWHLPVVMWLYRNVPSWPVGAKVTAAFGGSLAAGAASYLLVERPFLRRKRASA